MDSADSWRMLFSSWPANMPRTGLIVTNFGENITFINFMTSGGILLVERDRPDSSDARKVMIAYQAIAAVKSTSTMDFDNFKAFGFE